LAEEEEVAMAWVYGVVVRGVAVAIPVAGYAPLGSD
jgi:hypothetical protein